MYTLKRKFCSKFRKMADKQSDNDKIKKNPSNQISFTKTSLKIKDALTRFQDLKRANHKDSNSSAKGQDAMGQLGGLLNIPDMFSQENNYFEAAVQLVTGSDTTHQSSPIHIAVTPGESEACLLTDTNKQLIHKLIIQTLYKSSNCKTTITTNGHGYSVRHFIICDVTRN